MTDVAMTTALLAAHLRFVDASASVVTVAPQDVPTIPGTGVSEYDVTLVPTSALVADRAYSFEAESDDEFTIGFPDQTVAEGTSTLAASRAAPVAVRIPIFTGSAPQLAAIIFPIAPGKVPYGLQLRFSEPVQLGDLLPSAFGIELPGGRLLSGCVLSPMTGQCVVASAPDASSMVDFRFADVPPSESELAESAVVIAGSVRGSARTVAEGALVRGSNLQNTLLGPGIRTQLTAADWSDCPGGGRCVREVH